MKELKLADVKDFGNAEYFDTVDFKKGTVFVGDHCAEDYPQIVWQAKGKLKTGEKVNIYYITTPEDAKIDTEEIDWDNRFWKIELDED